jgi:hypothetical protein
MMGKLKQLNSWSLLWILILVFASCKKDVIESKELLVYMPGEFGSVNNSYTLPLVHTPVSVSGTTSVKIAPRATRELVTDVQVSIEADTTLVQQYNKRNNKSCLLLPANTYQIVHPAALTIKAGTVSSDSMGIEITHPELLNNAGGYVLPLRIVKVDGKDKGVLISSNQPAAFINVTYAFNNIKDEQVPLASSIMSRTGWNVTVSNTTTGALGPAMLDGSNTTAWRSSNSSTAAKWVILDMAGVKTVKGFRITPNYVAVAENATSITVSTSSDNVNFTTQGTWTGTGPLSTSSATNPDIKGINFIAPVQARYYRLDINALVSGSRVGIAELNAVE